METSWHGIFQSIINGIDEGIHAIDITGNTIFYNEIAAANDGVRAEEVIGKHIFEVFPTLSEDSSTLLKVIKTGQTIKDVPQSYENIHGTRIETVNTTFPLYINEKLIGAVEIAKDYTKLKKMAEQLLELQTIKKNGRIAIAPSSNRLYTFSDIITSDPYFQQQIHMAQKASWSDSPILVYGESGVGKELFVQSIHQASNRSNRPFIAQNCASLPETLLDSILFGTSKGSYTGAVEKPGLFELANGGTIFLDELHAMPLELQAKLLRVLEEKKIRRLGSAKTIDIDVRVMAAMNIEPHDGMEEGKLRPDLYYRLNVLSFFLPPLRERKEDIKILSKAFIDFFNSSLTKSISRIDDGLEKKFLNYNWPGNVRELKHTIEYMMNFAETSILFEKDLPPTFHKGNHTVTMERQELPPLNQYLQEAEKEYIKKALDKGEHNISKTAELLGIPRQTLQYKIKKYQMK
ncbi:sigma-54 interaction domain-containing protein [Falsibacillus pallidus]|uniref:Arginine utilization regulatory protein n=1 Tax=Falsibacillus pallidus TaxID=493781 RepID=A0A370GL41_9BACI|nr:sigma 54-interacting transcriptional regulator [Falsibacillus pallidus]RDI43094.1 arginine utilization regulatory protein [Falsibacillus pallidus]